MDARIHRDVIDKLLKIEEENFYERCEEQDKFTEWRKNPAGPIPKTIPFFSLGLVVDRHSEEIEEGFWATDNLWYTPKYITYYHWNEDWIKVVSDELKEYLYKKGVELPK